MRELMESETGPQAVDRPGQRPVTGQRPATGDPRVDDAVARLDDLAGLPVAEHPAVFEHVQQRLAEALGDLDARDRAAPDGDLGQLG
jgi:hypothetical protein